MKKQFLLLIACIPFFILSCGEDEKLFTKLGSGETGIEFLNQITENTDHNVLTYEYYYNGNGVAVGDFNNDGLTDLFFTGNQTPSRLFLNRGEMKFSDVTTIAGVGGKDAWRTGASVVDINGDGRLDIYVCYSAFGTDEDRANQLFINNGNDAEGNPVFSEEAAAYGVDAAGTYTSQAAFFDMDLDGDLDMFLLNHADGFYSPFFNTTKLRNLRHPKFGNRLYRNDEGKFTDISTEAGIYGSGINFGLGICVSDLNDDGWPDVFVSNDFHEQDFVYLNNGDGTFNEVCKEIFAHMSRSTMGVDIADYNNDLLPDVLALDMLPETNYRKKILQGADEYDKYNLMVDSGYGHQNSRNVLQLHQGYNADGLPVFSEIGQLAGVHATDWSWAPLFADFDNDGWKDVFVSNGYLRDYTSLDFIKYDVAAAFAEAARQGKDVSTRENYQKNMPLFDLIRKMPSTKIPNYIYRNNRDLTFTDESANWGLDDLAISSGSAYADLDNDGDLDLIVCNNNDPVWVYRNNKTEQQTPEANYLRISLEGDQKNRFGLGAKVILYSESGAQLQEMYNVRGYQSSVDMVLHFGLGKDSVVKNVEVYWTKDSVTRLSAVAANQVIRISKSDAVYHPNQPTSSPKLFAIDSTASGIDFMHRENEYVDIKFQLLLPYDLSRQGPKMATADVNGDGLDDFYIGGAAENSGALYIQQANGKFLRSSSQTFGSDAIYEDVAAAFFDADKDGDADLYVVSGGNEWTDGVRGLEDRLYLNDGKGNFKRHMTGLPGLYNSGGCIAVADYDKDGDPDLFIGGRTIPGRYPDAGRSVFLRNDFSADGGIKFTDITHEIANEGWSTMGMVTAAAWADTDGDGFEDLLVAGDWMPLKLFKNNQGRKLEDISEKMVSGKTDGWWCKIVPADIDGDGDIDFILGNMGTNTQFKASSEEPLITYSGDFNGDGKNDPILTWYIKGKSWPFNSRDELIEQMPTLNKKFLKYKDYANATIEDILTPEQLQKARKLYVYETRSSLLVNNNGVLELKPLPLEAQFSMTQGILYRDFDGDGLEDILLAGNFYPFRVQQGRSDAQLGTLLKGDGKGNFKPVNRKQSGLLIPGDVRDLVELKTANGNKLIASRNNNRALVIIPNSNK